ncbi:MAG: cytochrome c oxidase subunit II [Candidatus Omnitrophica bacterium]|nr:cytochrome c oxidase subunit II [Candidatus Omnitrophota bacterium]
MPHWGFPVDISTTGHYVDGLFWLASGLTGVAFLAVIGALGYFLLRYRAHPARRAYYTHGDSRGAIGVTSGLALLVFLLIDVNLAYHDHAAWEAVWGTPPLAKEALHVEIMPEQFAWNIRYAGPDGVFRTADDVTTINQLHVPANRPVVVQLSSKDVIHSFFLPNLRIKMDAVPGMVTSLYFQAKTPGTYEIACAEHCGFGHYRMRGFLVVESTEAFTTWMAEQAKEGPPDSSWGWTWGGAI